MSPKCTRSSLAALLFILLTGLTALGQEGVRDLPAAQLFDPADIRPYAEWDAPKEGFFFSFDGIWWTISAPKKTLIGQPGSVPVFLGPSQAEESIQTSNFDTGEFRAKQKGGDRIEGGYTDEHNGFLISSYELDCQTQHIYGQNVGVLFADPGVLGPLNLGYLDRAWNVAGTTVFLRAPVSFDTMSLTNHTYTNGIEMLYTYRQHLTHDGGQIQWMLGARYVRFDDEFGVAATGGVLAESAWDTSVKNRIYGPEVGVRWLKEFGRFGLSAEGRFMAGVNDQAINQYGELASALIGSTDNNFPNPLLMKATTWDQSAHETEFSPLLEFRVEGHVQLTRLISFKAGWTGMFLDNIGRACDMIDYTMPSLGILPGNNKQIVFIQGINIGVELNR